MNKIDEHLVENNLELYDFTDEMYKKLIKQSVIELNQLENVVIKYIKKGYNKSAIVEALRKEHGVNTSIADLNKFFARNRELAEKLFKENKSLEKRQADARLNLINKMAGLSNRIERLIDKWEKDDNAPAINSAISNLLKTWMQSAELMGLTQKKEEQQQVSILKIVSDKRERLVDKLHNADFTTSPTKVIDAEIKKEDTEETDGNIQSK